MKQTVFALVAVICVFAVSTQASGFGATENADNEIVITPAHLKHLKKIAYMLLEPGFSNFKENAPKHDAEKIFAYIENMRSTDPEVRIRAERDIKEMLNKLKSSIKKIVDKIKGLF